MSAKENTWKTSPAQSLSGEISVLGDKSISHRAIILSAISNNVTVISNISLGLDVQSTINAMRALGVNIILNADKKEACVHGVGLHGLKAPKAPIDCGNSGTTMRLLAGLLSAQPFDSVLVGDASLMRRPMLRVAEPLRLMGAQINLSENNTAAIVITGNQTLRGIHYELKIPSAQVKSAILLASLYASGETVVHELTPTRDHTERMLKIKGDITIPGDISSAAFFIVAATITKNSRIVIRDVGINPYRVGIIDILKLMGANIALVNHRLFGLEPVADVVIQCATLRGIVIPPELVSKAIDEFPVIFIAAAVAQGETILRDAAELRVKESDRLAAMAKGLRALGVDLEEYDDGILIRGGRVFRSGYVNAFEDHRVAMAFAIAGQVANDVISIDNCAQVSTSFPNFIELARQVGMDIEG